uniref:Snurportin-1 n=1 Tax=Macrostomum lignano TaxID=282301 RepID=A0A1I8IVH0_9PLAT
IDPSSADCGRARAVGGLPVPRAGRDLLLGPGSARRAAAAAGLAKAVQNCDEMMTEASGLPDEPVDPDGEDCGGDEEGEDSERRAAAKVMKEFLLSAWSRWPRTKRVRQRESGAPLHAAGAPSPGSRGASDAEAAARRAAARQVLPACGVGSLRAGRLRVRTASVSGGECRPVAAWCRGGLRAVVHARCSAEEVAAADCEDVCWPARLLTMELPDCHVTSISRSFDVGGPLPDGAACVTGRLKLFDTDSGELLRDLDTCDSVRAGRHRAAYSMSDGSRLLNYKYESEPLGLLLPRRDRLLALLPWERQPVHLFELLWEQREEQHEEQREEQHEEQREEQHEEQREETEES